MNCPHAKQHAGVSPYHRARIYCLFATPDLANWPEHTAGPPHRKQPTRSASVLLNATMRASSQPSQHRRTNPRQQESALGDEVSGGAAFTNWRSREIHCASPARAKNKARTASGRPLGGHAVLRVAIGRFGLPA
jgi:hypothetical protein